MPRLNKPFLFITRRPYTLITTPDLEEACRCVLTRWPAVTSREGSIASWQWRWQTAEGVRIVAEAVMEERGHMWHVRIAETQDGTYWAE